MKKNIVAGINILFIIFIILLAFFGSSKLNFGFLAFALYPALNLFCLFFLSKKENYKTFSFIVVALDFIAFVYLLVGSLFAVIFGSALGGKFDGGALLLAFLISLPAFINFIYFFKDFLKRIKNNAVGKEFSVQEQVKDKFSFCISFITIIFIYLVWALIKYPDGAMGAAIMFPIILISLLILINNYIDKQVNSGKKLKFNIKILLIIFCFGILGQLPGFMISITILILSGLILSFQPQIIFQEQQQRI